MKIKILNKQSKFFKLLKEKPKNMASCFKLDRSSQERPLAHQEGCKAFVLSFLLFFSFSFVFFHNSPSWARMNLPSPEALLQQAGLSRTELRNVIFEIEKNITEMTNQEDFEKYFFILDTLSVLSKKSNLDEIYPDAIKALGLKMVTHGQKWLDIRFNSAEKILYYHKYTNYDLASKYYTYTEYVLNEAKVESEIRKVFPTLELLNKWATETYPDLKELQLSYQRLMSDLAVYFLIKVKLADSNVDFWISKISHPSAYGAYLVNLSKSLYEIKVENKSDLKYVLHRTLLLNQKLLTDKDNYSSWIQLQLSSVLLEITQFYLKYELAFEVDEFDQVLSLLNRKDLVQLSYIWINEDRLPSENYVDSFLKFSQFFIRELQQQGLVNEAKTVKRSVGKALSAIYTRKLNIEGLYSVKDSNGELWNFTIILKNSKSIFAALAKADQSVLKGLFNVGYDIDNLSFFASEREGDLDASSNNCVYFKILSGDRIEIKDLFPQSGMRTLKGRRVQKFENYLNKGSKITETSKTTLPWGTYKGKLKFKTGEEFQAKLSVLEVNGNYFGRISFDKINVDFNFGEFSPNSVLSLTTGRFLSNTSWLHLRGYYSNKEIRGFLISAGLGVTTKEFVFKYENQK